MPADSRPFSSRHGIRPPEVEITVREDAPQAIREGVVLLADHLGLSPGNARLEVCGILLRRPDPDNWTNYPNVFNEVQWLVLDCPWYRVYDIAEGFYRRLEDKGEGTQFEDRLNQLFVENGVGWQMVDGEITARGSDAFSAVPKQAVAELEAVSRRTAAGELREAVQDLSRRPKPDRTGAIQHAMAALECVARDVAGQPSKTLGALIGELNLPKPLDKAIEMLWGYASQVGRHLEEGRDPEFEEAELVLTVAAGVSTYLTRRPQSL